MVDQGLILTYVCVLYLDLLGFYLTEIPEVIYM